MALILSTGVNPALLETRRMLLERAGHTVVTAMDVKTVIAACQQHAFDVAMVGHMVSPKEKRRIFGLIREHRPTAKVLELYPADAAKVLADADGWLAVPADIPQELAESVAALVERPSAKRAKKGQ